MADRAWDLDPHVDLTARLIVAVHSGEHHLEPASYCFLAESKRAFGSCNHSFTDTVSLLFEVKQHHHRLTHTRFLSSHSSITIAPLTFANGKVDRRSEKPTQAAPPECTYTLRTRPMDKPSLRQIMLEL